MSISNRFEQTSKYQNNLLAKQTAYLAFGNYNLYTGNVVVAIDDLNKCIKILETHPYYDQLKKAYNYQSIAYERLGKHKEALAYYKLFIANRDTLINTEKIRATLELENKYKNIKTEFEFQKNKKDLEIKRLRIKRNNILLWSLSSIVLILIASLFFVFRLLKLRRNDLYLLKNKNDIIEEKQREILASIRYAKRIQDSLLPPQEVLDQLFDENYFGRHDPRRRARSR